MAVRFHSSGDAILSYCTLFSMYITLWNMEQQSDTLLLLLYYSDFFYLTQYVCVKLSQPWLDTPAQESSDISLAESLTFIITPISLLPFHVVFKMGLDRGCFYQFVCFLRLFSLYQDGRIHIDDQGHRNSSQQLETVQQTRRSSHFSQAKVQMECQCKCRFPSEDFKETDSGNS